jgi:hypothetical protein
MPIRPKASGSTDWLKGNVHASVGLTGVATICGLTALCLPMHSLWWYTGFSPLFRMETHVLSVEVECTWPMPNWICEKFEGSLRLEDFTQRSCSGIISSTAPNFCEGFHNADLVGQMLVVVFVLNAILQCTAEYSFNYCMTSSRRKKCRMVGVFLQSIGVFFVVAVLAIYYAKVVMRLNDVSLRNMGLSDMGFVRVTDYGAGPTYGYAFMWVSCFLQIAAILVSAPAAKRSQEELMEEAHRRAKFVEGGVLGEVELYNYGGQPEMHPGMQPQVQLRMQMPQTGMYQPGMGGFQQPGFQQPWLQQPGFQQPVFR